MGVTLGVTSFRPVFVGINMDSKKNQLENEESFETNDLAKKEVTEDKQEREMAVAKMPGLLVLEVEKTLGRNLPRKLSLNLGLTKTGGSHSEPASPGLPSPGQNSGCVNLKWDDAVGRSKYKVGEYTSVTGQIAPETPTTTAGKTKAFQSSKQETTTFLTPKMQERPIKKRKAAASPSPNEDRAGNFNKRVTDRLVAQVGKLSKIVKDTYHPRKDLKTVVESLVSLVAQLRVGNTPQDSEEESLQEAESSKADVQTEKKVNQKDCATQTTEGKREDDNANKKDCAMQTTEGKREDDNVNKKDCATQTTVWEQKDDEVELLRQRIKNPKSALDLFETAKRKWPEDVFLKTKAVHLHPLKQWADPLVFFVADNKAAKTDEVLKKLGETHMGLKKVIEEERLKNGNIIGSKSVTYMLNGDEKLEEIRMRCLVGMDHKLTGKEAWDEALKAARKVVDTITNTGQKHAVLTVLNGQGELWRKTLECAMIDVEMSIDVNYQKPPGSEKTSTKKEGKREKKTYALIVEKKGTQYKDVLSSVKTAITGDPARSSIHTMRSTRDGNLLITLDKDDETIEELEKAIKQAAGDLAVRRARSDSGTEVLHVRGLDATTNKGEVIEALKVRLGDAKDKTWKVSDLRPNRNDTQAVTIVLRKEDAESILAEGYLRIGAVRCRAERRVETEKCRRCWAFDHKTVGCKGPDRRNACYKCGKVGHLAKECQNNLECPLCQEVGHRAGEGGCTKFRAALTAQRKKARSARSSKDGSEHNRPNQVSWDSSRCPRCWHSGHKKKECKGMDRENLCHQCAEEGHKASGCRNRPYCLFCNLEGHISGGENCPKATIAQQEKADEERQGSAKSRDEVAIPMSLVNEEGLRNPPKNEKEAGTSDARQKEVMNERDQNRVASEGEVSRSFSK
jgi:cellular nucleic acid-binding protein